MKTRRMAGNLVRSADRWHSVISPMMPEDADNNCKIPDRRRCYAELWSRLTLQLALDVLQAVEKLSEEA